MSEKSIRRLLHTCLAVGIAVTNAIILVDARFLGGVVIRLVQPSDDSFGSRTLLHTFPGIWTLLLVALSPLAILAISERRAWRRETFLLALMLAMIAAQGIAGVMGIIAYRHWIGSQVLGSARFEPLNSGRQYETTNMPSTEP